MRRFRPLVSVRRVSAMCGLATVLLGAAALRAEDHPQWGHNGTRNMVSGEKGLPERFDPKTGENVRWSAAIGTECYATPVVAGGRVYLGANNNQPRDPRHRGDKGVLMCFREADGGFLWQLVAPKLPNDIFLDWPNAGMCSPATVEGDRVYMMTNRDEVACLDVYGMANGNDGPFRDEDAHLALDTKDPANAGPLDADILWLVDLRKAAGVRPHDSVHGSILIQGRHLYVNTSNGLNSQHTGVERPEAPSLVVVDKLTGRLVARDREPIGPRIFHCTWSSPLAGDVNGVRRIFFAGGDGVCYGFAPFAPAADSTGAASGDGLGSLACVWRFDCDPDSPKENVHQYIRNRKESPSNIKSTPVLADGRLYVTHGGDIWWGKHQSWLKCIDATGSGDVTKTALAWSYPLGKHSCSTPSVADGLVYVADCDGRVHCVDAKTGKPCWVHDARGEIWASTLLADGRVYVGTRRGDFWVLAAGRTKKVLSSIRLDDPIHATPVAANGTLYVATMTRLYALATKPAATTPAAQ